MSDDLRGWKEIAGELGVHPRTAEDYALRNRDPLPVFQDHRGIVANRSAMRDWVERQRVHMVTARALTRARAQVRSRRRNRAAKEAAA